jgi:hypothetical protein
MRTEPASGRVVARHLESLGVDLLTAEEVDQGQGEDRLPGAP